MKVGLFVEGSDGDGDWLRRIWVDQLATWAGLEHDFTVIGISKATVVGMDPTVRSLSTTNEPFDALFSRLRRRHDLEAGVVCWDLIPKWNGVDAGCRWQETLDFYRLLAASQVLPDEYVERARARHAELSARTYPGQRPRLPALTEGSITAVIMDPMFEALICDERVVRTALGLSGARPPGWPSRWNSAGVQKLDNLIGEAIAAGSRVRPKPAVFRRIRGGFNVAKNEWGSYLLQEAYDSNGASVRESPIFKRLKELC